MNPSLFYALLSTAVLGAALGALEPRWVPARVRVVASALGLVAGLWIFAAFGNTVRT